jgi:hypothetical protein
MSTLGPTSWHYDCVMNAMNPMTGQIVLVGTAVAGAFSAKVAKGARCPMVSVVDCDRMALEGRMQRYEAEDGIDAGLLLDETLGGFGWTDIRIHACLPVADTSQGWEPELEALIKVAALQGIAHMVFEPEGTPGVLH